MDIRRLETFCAVYELGSFSKAAEQLYLAQPTISTHIGSLEKELGVSVFDRFSRMILPTQAGDVLYNYATSIIEIRNKAVSEIKLLTGQVTGTLLLGGSTIPGHYILPGYVADFQAKHPQVHISLDIGDSQRIEERVVTGSLDLGLIGGAEYYPELAYYPVARDELVLLAPTSTCHCGSEVDAQQMQALPWIVREAGSGTGKAMDALLVQVGVEPHRLRTVATVSSTQAVMACIRAGLGVSFVSSLAAAGPVRRQEVRRVRCPIRDSERIFYAVVHGQRAKFPASQAFLDALTTNQAVKGE